MLVKRFSAMTVFCATLLKKTHGQMWLAQPFVDHFPKKTQSGGWFGCHFLSSPYIGNNHPNWLIFFRGVAQPPTRNGFCPFLSTSTLNKPQGCLGTLTSLPGRPARLCSFRSWLMPSWILRRGGDGQLWPKSHTYSLSSRSFLGSGTGYGLGG